MGVHGLWKLIEPSGKPVPLETLENKVLAVDVSIWLHQAVKGFQDSKGAAIPNAHLLGIYHRVCKLLYFKIKPVFVFDGGVPILKKETIAKRNQLKARNQTDANRIQKQLLATLLKHSAINKVLSEKTKSNLPVSPKKLTKNDTDDNNIFKLPELDNNTSSSEEEQADSSYSSDSSPTKHWDIHTIDEKSVAFKSLPADVRHEILTDLKETRKQNSWGRLHELPSQSDDFSVYQMKRLLKRFSIQSSLEEVEKEMGGHSLSLGELESLLNDQGVITRDQAGNRIASDESKRFLFIKDLKQEIEKARIETSKLASIQEVDDKEIVNAETSKPELEEQNSSSKEEQVNNVEENAESKYDKEYQRDLDAAIMLSLQDAPGTSKPYEEDSILQNLDSDSSDDCEEIVQPKTVFSAAKSYMLEYSGLTPTGIDEILNSNAKKSNPNSLPVKKSKISKCKTVVEVTECEIVETNKEIVISDKQADSENITEIVEVVAAKDTTDKVQELTENVKENESTAKENDEVNVGDSEKGEESIAYISNSDSSDEFEEVKEEKPLEIIIDGKTELEDDIFADIFADTTPKLLSATNKEITNKATNDDGLKIVNNNLSNDLIKTKEIITEELNNKTEDKVELVISETDKSNKNISDQNETPNVLKQLGITAAKPSEITADELQRVEADLRLEKQTLISERSNKERLANNITDQMYQEAQELLELFGVPYITAPMEAEAQCAFLNEISLTDGTITDDSDIWLFGGKTVYKNFFSQNKYVLEYKSENIHHNFKLSRQQLILMALLVGSDYTTGVPGVGPVTALEILAAFPAKLINEINGILSYDEVISGLVEFRSWIRKGKVAGPGRTMLRTKLKNVTVGDNFPNLNVIRAYLEPEVETSRDEFSWGRPDIIALKEYARVKFGWTPIKSEEILKPVVQRLMESKSQTSIRDYFKTKHKITNDNVTDRMSKRVKKAVGRIGNKDACDEEEIKKPARVGKKNKIANEPKSTNVKQRKRNKNDIAKPCETQEDLLNLEKPETSISKINIESNLNIKGDLLQDEEVKVLLKAEEVSQKRVKEIEIEAKIESEKRLKRTLHKKESIPQRERDKSNIIRTRLKAIEVFRKSKQGPGFIKKRGKQTRKPKSDAELSESSSDD